MCVCVCLLVCELDFGILFTGSTDTCLAMAIAAHTQV